MIKISASVALVFAFALLGTRIGVAQTPAAQVASNAEPAISEIIVTARKRAEPLQDVPIAVTVLTAEEIEDAAIRNAEDIARLTPGLTWTALFGTSGAPVIRGVSTNIGEANVGFFLDGVYQSSRAVMDTLLDGIERIEVAKGPQSALYGRNTFGGAINFITKPAPEAFEANVEATLGSDGRQEARAALGGPVSGKALAVRAGFAYTSFDGYFTNELTGDELDDRESILGSISLESRPSDDVKLVFRAGYETTDNGDYPLRFVPNNTGFFAPLNGNQVFRGELPSFDSGFAVTPGYFERDNLNLSFSVDASLGAHTFTSITGYNDLSIDNLNDNDFSAAVISQNRQQIDQSEWSQEFRLASDYEGRVNWIAGLYYYELESDLVDDNRFLSPGIDALFAPPMGPLRALGLGSVLLTNAETTENYAGFGSINIELTERVRLGLAARYSYEEKTLDTFNINPYSSLVLADLTLDDSWDSFTPEATLDFHLNRDAMLYARVAQATKSGGFNGLANVTDAERRYDQETSWNYELGVKSTWLDRRLTLNGALFYIDWKDQIVRALGASNAILNTNAGKTTSQGIEIELLARPIDNLDIRAGYAYTDAKYDEYIFGSLVNLGLDPDLSGVPLQNVSKNTANASLQFTAPVAAAFGWVTRLDVSYRSKQNAVQTGDAYVGESTRVDLRTGLESERWEAVLWGRNLTDDDAAASATFIGNRAAGVAVLGGAGIQFFNALVTAAEPRSYGVTLRYRF